MVVRIAPPALPKRFDSRGREIPRVDELPESDGIPRENHFHVLQSSFLVDLLAANWQGRDYFSGGGTFLHYSLEQVRNRDFLGPDFFVVLGAVLDSKRKYWAVWDENYRFPDMILEMNSPSTEKVDLTEKKRIYGQVFKTSDYICFDSEEDKLRGWHLVNGRYRAIPERKRGMWCESLQLHLRRWTGKAGGRTFTWLRWFDKDGRMLPTEAEKWAAAEAEAVAARIREDTANLRARAAEEEVRLLREQLAKLTGKSRTDGKS